MEAGVEGVVHYQETYDRTHYAQVHPTGWKRDFDRRLTAVDDAGLAGARRLGLGVLLGLAPDWRADVLALAGHARELARRHWRSEITLSLPRITRSASGFRPVVEVGDRHYVQALAALRLAEPDAGIVVSTREPAWLRDGLTRIALTHMSAGSSTEPGGYTVRGRSQEQFAVTDRRPLPEVATAIAASGYQPVLRDAVTAEPGIRPAGHPAARTNATLPAISSSPTTATGGVRRGTSTARARNQPNGRASTGASSTATPSATAW